VVSHSVKIEVSEMGGKNDEDVDYEEMVTLFYEKYAPEKVDKVEDVLLHFKGRESDLIHTLEKKYGVKFQPMTGTFVVIEEGEDNNSDADDDDDDDDDYEYEEIQDGEDSDDDDGDDGEGKMRSTALMTEEEIREQEDRDLASIGVTREELEFAMKTEKEQMAVLARQAQVKMKEIAKRREQLRVENIDPKASPDDEPLVANNFFDMLKPTPGLATKGIAGARRSITSLRKSLPKPSKAPASWTLPRKSLPRGPKAASGGKPQSSLTPKHSSPAAFRLPPVTPASSGPTTKAKPEPKAAKTEVPEKPIKGPAAKPSTVQQRKPSSAGPAVKPRKKSASPPVQPEEEGGASAHFMAYLSSWSEWFAPAAEDQKPTSK